MFDRVLNASLHDRNNNITLTELSKFQRIVERYFYLNEKLNVEGNAYFGKAH